MDKKHKGAWAELIACAKLLEMGYEVFRNVSAHGIADLIAWKGNEIIKFDVKIVSIKTVKGREYIRTFKPTVKQERSNVRLIKVFPDGTVDID